MKRTFLATIEVDDERPLDPDFDRGVALIDMGEDHLYQKLNGLFEGTIREARVSRVTEVNLDLETPRMLVLSTAHITKETDSNFEIMTDDVPGTFYAMPCGGIGGENYGWMIPCGPNITWSHMVSADLVAIRKLAESVGAMWIMLDRDGNVIDELPKYEW